MPIEDKRKQINEKVEIIIFKEKKKKKKESKQMKYKVENIESYIKTTMEYMEQLKLFFFGSILERVCWGIGLFFFFLKLIEDNLH